jgi:hypothetical protein
VIKWTVGRTSGAKAQSSVSLPITIVSLQACIPPDEALEGIVNCWSGAAALTALTPKAQLPKILPAAAAREAALAFCEAALAFCAGVTVI